MNDTTAQILETIADKLGTTTEYLWSVLLSQAPIDAFLTVVGYSIWVIASVSWMRFSWGKLKTPEPTPEDRYPTAEWEEEPWLGWITFIIAGFIALITASVMVFNVGTALLNPEYWALKEILSAFN